MQVRILPPAKAGVAQWFGGFPGPNNLPAIDSYIRNPYLSHGPKLVDYLVRGFFGALPGSIPGGGRLGGCLLHGEPCPWERVWVMRDA